MATTVNHERKTTLVVEFEPLRWIGAYRLVKGGLALIGAIMLLRLMHDDLPATALHWMHRLRIDAEGRVGAYILKKVVDIPPARVGLVAAFLLGYTGISFVEGRLKTASRCAGSNLAILLRSKEARRLFCSRSASTAQRANS